MAGKVVHWEIPMDDPERGVAFYESALGWTPERWGDMEYWTVGGPEGDGIGGGLTRRDEQSPSVTFYVDVVDIDATLARIEASGGTKVTDRMPIPGMGWMAVFIDTEGNRLGLFQHDPSVAPPA